jgi:RNA polymerase sigma-70 factor, ECF subfamily
VAAPDEGAAVDQRSLVERAQRGDHDAFAVLAREAVARLDAAARLILRDRELARDAVQETLIGAWRNLPGLRDPHRFEAWLHRLLVRACVDGLRRRRSRPIEIEMPPNLRLSMPDFAQGIAQRELVDEALRRLDPAWRALVVLHFYLGLPLPEAAAVLGIPLGTAKSRLHRSLGVMRSALERDAFEAGAMARGPVA